MAKKKTQHETLKAGEVVQFDPERQVWWPTGKSPANAELTVSAMLARDTAYHPSIGIRTRDVEFEQIEDA